MRGEEIFGVVGWGVVLYMFCIYLPLKWLGEELLPEYQWAVENLHKADIIKHMATYVMDVITTNLSMIPDLIGTAVFLLLFLLVVNIPLFIILTLIFMIRRKIHF